MKKVIIIHEFNERESKDYSDITIGQAEFLYKNGVSIEYANSKPIRMITELIK